MSSKNAFLLVVGLLESFSVELLSVEEVAVFSAVFVVVFVKLALFATFAVFAVFVEEPPNGQPTIKRLENTKTANFIFIIYQNSCR